MQLDYSDGLQMISTDDLVDERLRERAKTTESEIVEEFEIEDDKSEDFVEDSVPQIDEGDLAEVVPAVVDLPQKSATEELLDQLEDANEVDSHLQSFAHFEATEGSVDSKQFLILFPFAKNKQGFGTRLKISVLGSAVVSDFIGLCCLLYSRSGSTPKCTHSSDYELYLADDNLEIDTFLPPLEDNRTMSECGFPTLALLQKRNAISLQMFTITIHLVNKKRFILEVPSLEMSLQWVFDNALIKRNQMQEYPNVGILHEYVLETLKGHKDPLKLNNTIASAKTLDFVLLRKNSSRGDLIPSRSTSDPNSSVPDVSSSPCSKSRTPEHKRIASSAWNEVPLLESFDQDSVLCEYAVERIHRLKPKSHAMLLFRDNTLDIVPVSTERRRTVVLSHSSAKPLSIDWDFVAGVEIADRTSSKRILKIIWLPVPETLHYYFSGSEQGELPSPMSLQFSSIDFESHDSMLRNFYESVNWKTLQLEVPSDEVFKIANEINDIIEPRESRVRKLYQNSGGGSRKPGAVTDSFRTSLSPSLSSSTPTTPVPKLRKKISIVPVLTRMLSKHDQTSSS
ncbi:hypothetical protein L596_003059 [Steinernema carpocapsae]|uniref:Target of rapamycin complex 2 subunit MAPKAP1 n=1 Tax=Steinernema carpocapsae TaxID=34508 RepID=A0A4U8USZ0_STECR|nr:hypothetical protein L596_003059 [Steinernema carpocapsae]